MRYKPGFIAAHMPVIIMFVSRGSKHDQLYLILDSCGKLTQVQITANKRYTLGSVLVLRTLLNVISCIYPLKA